MARLQIKQIKGLQLAVNRKQIEAPFVCEGKNFIIDVEGPKSGFSDLHIHRQLALHDYVESFELSDRIVYFAKDEQSNVIYVYTHRWQSKQWDFLFALASSSVYASYAVSIADIGGRYFFAHKGFGVISLEALTNDWIDETANFPSDTFAITDVAGRCFALAAGIVAWSAIDNGSDFVPSITTGAGLQSLALIGTPKKDSEYIGVWKVPNGVFTCTKTGIMKSTIIDSQLVFRHKALSDNEIPINPHCVASLSDNEHVFLAKTGMYKTRPDGNGFEVFDPLMSEYIKNKIIPTLNQDHFGQIALDYSRHKQWMCLSLSTSQVRSIFQLAYVNYTPKNEWGVFNHGHKAFVHVDTREDMSHIDFGYIDAKGRMAVFIENTHTDEIASNGDTSPADLHNAVFYLDNLFDSQTMSLDGVTTFTTQTRMSSDEQVFDGITFAGKPLPDFPAFYELFGLRETTGTETEDALADILSFFEGDIEVLSTSMTFMTNQLDVYGFKQQRYKEEPLDSYIHLGVFRLTNQEQIDQITEISNLHLSMPSSEVGFAEFADWLTDFDVDVFEDWLTAVGQTDWGFDLGSRAVYTPQVIGTLDGETVWNEQIAEAEEVYSSGDMRFFSCQVQGLYVLVAIQTEDVNEFFHLKTLELNGLLAGRL